MAKIKTPAMTPKMYRHFAVLTLVSTLLMAMLADGENRDAIAAEMAARQRAAERQKASEAKFGTPSLIRKNEERDGGGPGWADVSGDYGEPMDDQGSTIQTVRNFGQDTARSRAGYEVEAFEQFGITEAELAAMTPQQRAALMARMRAAALSADASARDSQVQSLLAASSNRSGGDGDTD